MVCELASLNFKARESKASPLSWLPVHNTGVQVYRKTLASQHHACRALVSSLCQLHAQQKRHPHQLESMGFACVLLNDLRQAASSP